MSAASNKKRAHFKSNVQRMANTKHYAQWILQIFYDLHVCFLPALRLMQPVYRFFFFLLLFLFNRYSTIGSFHGECRMHRSFQEIYRFCARWAWPVNSGDDEDGVPTDWLIEWMNEWVNARISCTLNSQAMPAAKWQIYILHGFK